MRYLKRAIHLDFHTMPKVPDVGVDFNAKEFAGTLKQAHVDFVNVFARCNLGFAYYPTKIGIVHPSLKLDMLGQMIEECHNRDIGVAAYFNAGLDHEHAIRHREWCVVNQNGQVHTDNKMNHFFRMMCFNTGYGDHLAGMVQEVLDLYPVDGIFLDCIGQPPCYGNECLDAMVQQGIDITDAEKVAEFSRQTKIDFAERIRKLVDQDTFLYFNGIPYKEQIAYASHVELECLPTGGWGYDNFPSNVRYARSLGKQVLGMTGRFHESWGDFGGIRPQASLEFDCFHAVSNGVGCSVGDHMHPRGKLDPHVYDLIGKVYSRIREIEPWTDHARPLTEIAVVSPGDSQPWPHLRGVDNVVGATRMLSELNYQFDIVDEDMEISAYKVLILPDNVVFGPKLKDKIRAYIKRGGAIVSSAYSGLNSEKTEFALKEWNASCTGPEEWNISFFKPVKGFDKEMPDMLTTIYSPGISMKAGKGAEVQAHLHQPYFNKHWDGFHGYLYIPPDKCSDRPALIQSGNIFHFSFPVFSGYYEHAVVAYRDLVRNCIEKVLPEPIVQAENVPSFGRVTVTGKEDMTMVHILTYCPELRGKKLQVIEEPIATRDVVIKLKADTVKTAYLAPTREGLDLSREGNYVSVLVPEIKGYQMIVFESDRSA